MRWLLATVVVVLMGAAPVPHTRVLVISTSPRIPTALAELDVTVRAPAKLPADLGRYDFVIVSDVPMHLLGEPQVAALDAYARAGGALLVAGRENSLGTGGYEATAMEKLLPVRIGSEKSNRPDAAVVLVGDGSRSLAKATRLASDSLSLSDYLAVLASDRVVVQPQRVANRERIAEQSAQFVPGGGGGIIIELDDALSILQGISANTKQIIVLSTQDLPTDLVRDIRAAGITVTVAKDRDVPARIAAMFQPPTDVRVIANGDEIDVENAPTLDTYVTTSAKSSSDVLLESAYYKEPLFARWCYGGGTVAVWTSIIDGDPAFWAQLLRATKCSHPR